MKHPNSKIQKILNFLKTIPEGAYVTYQDIEAATGIKMCRSGKASLYRALHQAKRSWLVQRDTGIELDGPANAMSLVSVNVGRTDRSIDKTHGVLGKAMQYAALLRKEEQQQVILLASAFGAMLGARQAFALGSNKPLSLNTISTLRLPHL